MLQIMRLALCWGLVMSVVLSGGSPALADKPRHAAMILDANTGKVLHEASADELRHPASLTKLMTIYMALEEIAKGNLTLETRIPVSAEATSVSPSKLGLEAGSTIELADAIKALVTKSANDMAVAIAERIGGTEANFASLMTKRARAIGMKSTVFRNASGLPDSEQLTTARDMITLALRLHDDFPDKVRVFKLREFTYAGKTYRTHNTLMKSFAGMDGMKTGYTRASGFNLVASVHRDGKFIIGAVFGGATASSRNAHMRNIMTRALDEAATEKTRTPKPMLVASMAPAKRATAKPVAAEKQSKPANEKPAPEKPMAVAIAAPAPIVSTTPKPIKAPAAGATPQPDVIPEQRITVTAPRETVPEPQQALTVSPPVDQGDTSAQSISVTPPSADTEPLPDAGIQVAKVRAVPMPSQPAAVGALAADPQLPKQQASAASGLDFSALKRAVAALKPNTKSATDATALETNEAATSGETVIAKARKPSTLQAQAASVAPSVDTETTVAENADAPARTPSTLQAQAATLAPPAPAPRVVLAAAPMQLGANTTAAQLAAEGYAIQIGAYGSAAEAERQIGAVQGKAGPALSGASPATRPVTANNGRQLYAARFMGFDQLQASNACNQLRQQSIDCFVVQAR